MQLPPEVVGHYMEHIKRSFAGVMPDPEGMCLAMFSEEKANETLESVESHTGRLQRKRLLEVGCGNGMFLAIAQRAGVHAYGVEPDRISVQTAARVITACETGVTVAGAVGEALPFGDEVFDVVCSSYVLEHVRDVSEVLRECVRVLKTGGYAHFLLPNYGSIWEGHYQLPWLPYQPKWLAKVWVRLFGRDASYLDTLHLITQGKLEGMLKGQRNVEVVTYGHEVWRERLMSSELGVWGNQISGLKRFVRLLHRIGLVRVVALGVRALRAHYPIVLVVRKKG